MVRAGTQQLSLPDIYKMFKTASDEDKIKLMNTYANLGERLGEYDKDLEYRRTQGDKDALKEKTITEGISDVLGSAWDYTKQGASSLRDLIKGDSLKDEEPLPVNDTPLPWKVEGNRFVGSKEDDKTLRDLVTSEQLPWEAEGNAFVGSKENADVDPLAGGMSRDPSIKLYEPESEDETLSPQEQRFLGVDSTKEKVVESPMARRAQERLAKLNARQEQYANDPDARWSELYNIDPERATFDWNRIAPKGGGAASVVQARLEHDMRIDQEIADKTTQLRLDQLANGWTSTSPEFLERYGEIQSLEASKYYKKSKNTYEKTVGLTNKELDQKVRDEKFEFDKEKEVTEIDKKAFDVTNNVMGDLMGEKYNMPAKYGHIASSLSEAVADPENINETGIKDAVKAFIQSIDDSVVMAHESKSFADQSTLGQIRATLQGLVDDNIYSPDRLEEIWDVMGAYMDTYKEGIKNIAESGKEFYGIYGGSNPAVFDSWFKLMTINANLPPKPDFSVAGPWWEKLKAQSKKGSKGEPGLYIPAPKPKPKPKPDSSTGSSTGKLPVSGMDKF